MLVVPNAPESLEDRIARAYDAATIPENGSSWVTVTSENDLTVSGPTTVPGLDADQTTRVQDLCAQVLNDDFDLVRTRTYTDLLRALIASTVPAATRRYLTLLDTHVTDVVDFQDAWETVSGGASSSSSSSRSRAALLHSFDRGARAASYAFYSIGTSTALPSESVQTTLGPENVMLWSGELLAMHFKIEARGGGAPLSFVNRVEIPVNLGEMPPRVVLCGKLRATGETRKLVYSDSGAGADRQLGFVFLRGAAAGGTATLVFLVQVPDVYDALYIHVGSGYDHGGAGITPTLSRPSATVLPLDEARRRTVLSLWALRAMTELTSTACDTGRGGCLQLKGDDTADSRAVDRAQTARFEAAYGALAKRAGAGDVVRLFDAGEAGVAALEARLSQVEANTTRFRPHMVEAQRRAARVTAYTVVMLVATLAYGVLLAGLVVLDLRRGKGFGDAVLALSFSVCVAVAAYALVWRMLHVWRHNGEPALLVVT